MQQRLSAGDGHAVQYTLTLFQKGEDLLLIGILSHQLRQNQGRIVTEGAAEVAAAGEYRAGYSARIVQ